MNGSVYSRTVFDQRKSQPFLLSPHTHGPSSPQSRTPCSHSDCVCVCKRERERERERERDNLIKSKSQGVCLYGQTLRPYISHTGVCVCLREREREREREGVHNGLDYYYYFRLIKEIYEDCIKRINTCMNYYQNILANIKISKIFLYVLIRILANIKISKIFLYMHELLSNFLFHHFQFNKAMFCLEP